MNVCALDLGIHTGWASCDNGREESGTWTFKGGKDRDLDQRIVDLYTQLGLKLDTRLGLPIYQLVVFEDVEFSVYTAATQLWASFRAAMWIVCSIRGVPCKGVPVGTLKKFATGHGGATKDMMAAWWVRTHPQLHRLIRQRTVKKGALVIDIRDGRNLDDNEVDALHLLHYAQQKLA